MLHWEQLGTWNVHSPCWMTQFQQSTIKTWEQYLLNCTWIWQRWEDRGGLVFIITATQKPRTNNRGTFATCMHRCCVASLTYWLLNIGLTPPSQHGRGLQGPLSTVCKMKRPLHQKSIFHLPAFWFLHFDSSLWQVNTQADSPTSDLDLSAANSGNTTVTCSKLHTRPFYLSFCNEAPPLYPSTGQPNTWWETEEGMKSKANAAHLHVEMPDGLVTSCEFFKFCSPAPPVQLQCIFSTSGSQNASLCLCLLYICVASPSPSPTQAGKCITASPGAWAWWFGPIPSQCGWTQMFLSGKVTVQLGAYWLNGVVDQMLVWALGCWKRGLQSFVSPNPTPVFLRTFQRDYNILYIIFFKAA